MTLVLRLDILINASRSRAQTQLGKLPLSVNLLLTRHYLNRLSELWYHRVTSATLFGQFTQPGKKVAISEDHILEPVLKVSADPEKRALHCQVTRKKKKTPNRNNSGAFDGKTPHVFAGTLLTGIFDLRGQWFSAMKVGHLSRSMPC